MLVKGKGARAVKKLWQPLLLKGGAKSDLGDQHVSSILQRTSGEKR